MTRVIAMLLIVSLFTIESIGDEADRSPSKKGTKSQSNVQFLMRDKLEHAQNILEGIVTEDYDKIAESAEWMRMISRAASWQAIDTDEYKRHSKDFQSSAVRLRDQSVRKNLDATTLHHVRLTLGCIECHRYIRNYRAAK